MCSMPVPSLPQVHPMRLGVWAFNFCACADPQLQVRAAVAAAESGFGSMWTAEVPRFAGRFAAFDGIRFEPKPRQRPHPPIAIGGRSPRALRRAARFASGWYGFGLTVDGTAAIVGELRRLRVELGRGAEPLEISLTTFEPLTPEPVERATEVGIDRLIVMPTVPGDRLEATVRALGARFASGRPGRQPSDQSE